MLLIASVVALLAIGLFVWDGLRHQQPDNLREPVQQAQAGEPPPASNGGRPVLPGEEAVQMGDSPTNRPPRGSRADQLKAGVNSMNVPIRFWGLVVDQDNAPLPGVKVLTHLRTWRLHPMGIASTDFPQQKAVTGADGRFEIEGGQGDVLAVESLQKQGYEPEPRACRSFIYDGSEPFIPDRNSPVVLRMWPTNLHARLLAGSRGWSLVPDGRVYTVDLRRGTCSVSNALEGDFRISMTRAADAATARRFDWSLVIQAIGGGFLEETNPTSAMFEAPADGYTKEIRLSQSAADRRWSPGTRKRRLYLQSGTGQRFGRIEIQAYANSLQTGQARFFVDYTLNEEGGRLLR